MRHNFLLPVLAIVGASQAATLPYQGILTDAAGNPIKDGKYAIDVALYGQSTGGTALWTESQNATTKKGLFSIQLGSITAIPDAAFLRDSLFLGISVGGASELTPRTRFGAVPWAVHARHADTAQFTKNEIGLGAKVDTSALTIRLSGYASTTALADYAPLTSLTSFVKTTDLTGYAKATDLAGYATSTALVNSLEAKVDTAALTTRLGGYAQTTALAGYATTTSLSSYAPLTSLASYAKTTDLTGYAKATDLAGYATSTSLASYAPLTSLASYAKTTALASYATTAALNSKMATADYVETGHLKAVGGLTGGRGQSVFVGSALRVDTLGLAASAGTKAVSLTHAGLAWSDSYDQWRISAIPGGAFSLISGNRTFDMTVLTMTTSGAQFAGDVKIDGNLTLKTAATIVPDYVFEPEYRLAPLSEVEAYTKENKHLPEIPSATEIEKGGLDLAQMNLLLLKKIEELTLHAIAQEKRIQALEAKQSVSP